MFKDYMGLNMYKAQWQRQTNPSVCVCVGVCWGGGEGGEGRQNFDCH